MKQVKRAKTLVFEKIKFTKFGIRFFYQIDRKKYSFFSSVRVKIGLGEEQKYLIAANIGLSYLIDLAQISLPQRIIIKTIKLAEEAIDFWKETYKKVAIERIYAEKLTSSYLDTQWHSEGKTHLKPLTLTNNQKILLAISGGKESLAALKIFSRMKNLTLLFLQYPDKNWFYTKKAYDKLSKKFSTIKIRSTIVNVRKVMKIYGCKDCNMFIIGQLIFHGLLFSDKYRYLVIGNEYSANFGNTIYQEIKVNHQYDKTIYFARKINQYIHKFINKNFLYFSPFFGLYEYKIAQVFFANRDYVDVWTSCNNSSSRANFCCRCPKCAFIYALSLPFCTKKFLRNYFPKDLFQNVNLYKPLMDFASIKPLECVGEKIEIWFALYQVYKQKKDRDSSVMRYFLKNIFPKIKHKMSQIERQINKEQTNFLWIPTQFKQIVIKKITKFMTN